MPITLPAVPVDPSSPLYPQPVTELRAGVVSVVVQRVRVRGVECSGFESVASCSSGSALADARGVIVQ